MTGSKQGRGVARRMFGWRGRVGLDGGTIDRPAVVKLLKSGCTLAQGFCMVLFILSLLGVAVSIAELGRVVAGPRSDASGAGGQVAGEASLVERLYLLGEEGSSDASQTVSDRRWGNLVNGSASAGLGTRLTDAAGQAGVAGQAGAVGSNGVDSKAGSAGSTHASEAPGIAAQGEPDTLMTNASAPIAHIARAISSALLLMAIFWVGARFFRRIAVSGEPFRPERARELSHVADLLLVLAIAPGLVEAGTLWLGVVLLPDVSYDITYGFLNYGLLVGAILMIAFVRIFSYGCLLQQQDDELV